MTGYLNPKINPDRWVPGMSPEKQAIESGIQARINGFIGKTPAWHEYDSHLSPLRAKILAITNAKTIPELDEMYDTLNEIDLQRGRMYNIPIENFGESEDLGLTDYNKAFYNYDNARLYIQHLIVQKTIGHSQVQSVNTITDLS